MFTFLFALLASLGFLSPPAMDSDPAPVSVKSYAQPAPAPEPVLAEDGSVIEDPATYYADCTPYVVPETDEGWDTSRYLLGLGWTGRPDDGMEALYPPNC